ncbi:S8 family serine peptidase [Actinomadura rupiterrae]|uniref:S8 family serine peptidase n=1 Tax=Actinomadura rupiterrae TaxID=559627 RepID=UPI0020A512F6|nr:S8 family serine peptidase [Actinomadura rupiterrae]MCP2337496.1 subtilisin family serine protease [Actinomadura rupiterrae]
MIKRAARPWRRLTAAVLAGTAAINSPVPAGAAALSPRPDEWWFRTWSIQDKIWPTTRGAGVTIAVLDYGVNAKLPELSGAVVPGVDLIDQSTDGRVDLDSESPGHGTAMTVQMVGRGGGATGYVGIAPESKVLPIRVPVSTLDGDVLAKAITTAVDRGAKVINMSFGQTSSTFLPVHCSPQLAPAIGYALEHDAVLVASAGNDGNADNAPEQPASCPGVLAVGGVTKNLTPWKKTQRQNYVTLAAPGADTTLVDKHGVPHSGAGTSSASALTSAAVALIRAANPTMPARTVVQRLFATARPVGGPGWNDRTGFGWLDLAAAIDPRHHPVSASSPNPLYDAYAHWQGSATSAKPSGPTAKSAQRADKHDHSSRVLWISGGAGTTLLVLIVGAALITSRVRKSSVRTR